MSEQRGAAIDFRVCIQLSDKIALVECAAQVFGQGAAKRLWAELGLPVIAERKISVSDTAKTTVADFLGAATESAQGKSILARDLYRAYSDWAVKHNLDVMTERVFGSIVPTVGVKKKLGRVRQYLGVKFKDPPHG